MNKLGVESIISNICGKNKDMNSHLFSADMKLADVIHADYSLLLLLHRFGINLGFGDKTVRECCEANHVSCTLFLMICNVYSNEQYLPTEKEIQGIGGNVDQLIAYLKNSHSYFLDFCLPAIRRKLIEAIDCSQDGVAILILKFYDEYVNEVRRHMEYEDNMVFGYVSSLLEGKKNSDYNILVFARKHNQIQTKLTELKNIIIKYYPAERSNNSLNSVLFDIYSCEQDLASHCNLEDLLFVPAVAQLEKKFEENEK